MTQWRRNQAAVTIATFIGFTGFTIVMPFLPLYFEQLGVHDPAEIAIWSGVSLGMTPAITALMAPFWARIADRFGRKLMVARSLASFVLIMGLLGFVQAPWQVLALRAIQGLFAGYGPIAMAMAAESAPPEQVAHAIGWVQSAQRLGPALGPVIGGTLAQTLGLRNTFLVSSSFYLFALILVMVGFREIGERRMPNPAGATGPASFETLRRVPHFVLFMATVFCLQLVDRSFGPILPLYLREAGAGVTVIPFLAGIIFTTMAGAGGGRQSDQRMAAEALAARSTCARRRGLGGDRDVRVRRRSADRYSDRDGGRHGTRTRRRDDRGVHRRDARGVAVGANAGLQLPHDGLPRRPRGEPDDCRPRRVVQRPRGVSRRCDRPGHSRVDRAEAHVTDVNVITVDPESCRADDLADAVGWLRAGRIVVFPTDTFYGLAVDPISSVAVRDLFRLKGRASDAAVPLIAASLEQVQALGGRWTPAMSALARTFWPGPVSLICEAPSAIAPDVHGGAGTIAIRVPDHRVARALAGAWGAPVTATSANRSGEPPAASVAQLSDLARDPAVLVVDAGPTAGGLPSTIVDARGEPMVLVRAGAIAWNRVLESIQG